MEVHAVKTWYDQHLGVVEVEDDVVNVVRDIREISPRIRVFYNEQRGNYDIVESCQDGTDRLIFSVDSLDARVPLRLRQVDQWRGREDPEHLLPEEEDFLAKMDAAYDRMDAERQEENRDQINEVGEQLAWAGEQDRRGVGAQILVPRSIDG